MKYGRLYACFWSSFAFLGTLFLALDARADQCRCEGWYAEHVTSIVDTWVRLYSASDCRSSSGYFYRDISDDNGGTCGPSFTRAEVNRMYTWGPRLPDRAFWNYHCSSLAGFRGDPNNSSDSFFLPRHISWFEHVIWSCSVFPDTPRLGQAGPGERFHAQQRTQTAAAPASDRPNHTDEPAL